MVVLLIDHQQNSAGITAECQRVASGTALYVTAQVTANQVLEAFYQGKRTPRARACETQIGYQQMQLLSSNLITNQDSRPMCATPYPLREQV